MIEYEGEKYVGRVKGNVNGKVKVRCLAKPYGSERDFGEFERENDAVFYERIWKPRTTPKATSV